MVPNSPNADPLADGDETASPEIASPSIRRFVNGLAEAGLLNDAEVRTCLDFIALSSKTAEGADAKPLAIQLVQVGRLTPFQARAAYQGRAVGLRFGEYEIVDLIDQGGMGLVLKARHRRLKRWAAIKLPDLRGVGNGTEQILARFHREVGAGAKLRHENIVVTYDAGEERGVPFLAMEYVAGWNLGEFVKQKGPLSAAEAVYCVTGAARGLAHAHRAGIVHRDIKPKNLMLAITSEAMPSLGAIVKVLDFGLVGIQDSTNAGDSWTVTRPGQIMGTPEYMSPEQAEETHAVDYRTDIYSLGCTLHYLLVGRSPYGNQLLARQTSLIPSLRAFRPDIPVELDSVFQRMLAKEPANRPESMDEVIIALEKACSPSPPNVEMPQSTIPSSRELDELLSTPLRIDLSLLFTTSCKVSTVYSPKSVAKRHRLNRRWPRRLLAVVAFAIVAILLAIQAPFDRWFPLRPNIETDASGAPETSTTLPASNVADLQFALPPTDSPVVVHAPQNPDPAVPQGSSPTPTTFPPTSQFVETPKPASSPPVDDLQAVEKNLRSLLTETGEFHDAGDLSDPKNLDRAWTDYFAPERRAARRRQSADRFGVQLEQINSVGMRLTLIPPGLHGPGKNDADARRNAHLHPNGLYYGACEVSQGQFRALTGMNPSAFANRINPNETDSLPVENVTWREAVDFCNRLSQLEGLRPCYRIDGERAFLESDGGYRLCECAEWNYAASAGYGPDNDQPESDGDRNQSKTERPNNVGKDGNVFGMYDANGNVGEWCWSEREQFHVHGGSFMRPKLRTSELWVDGDGRSKDVGFRVARAILPIDAVRDPDVPVPGRVPLNGLAGLNFLGLVLPKAWKKDEVFADIKEAGLAATAKIDATSFVVESELVIHSPKTHISFSFGSPKNKTQIEISPVNSGGILQESLRCRLGADQESAFAWSDTASVPLNQRMWLKLIVTDERRILLLNAEHALSIRGSGVDVELSIEADSEARCTIRRIWLRPVREEDLEPFRD